MDLLIFDFSLGHSRDMEDDPFVRSTRQRWLDYNSETANKNSNIYIRTTLNENDVVTTNVSEDRIPPSNSHFSNNISSIERHTDILHLYSLKYC